jgi:hypothetical protein
MNFFIRLNGHNPESKSAKERERKRKLPLLGAVKCCKCKSSGRTLLRRRIDGKEVYICKTCWEIRERKARKEKFGR